MKASELIIMLEKLIDEHGDLEVEIPVYNDIDYESAKDARTYTYNMGTEFERTVIMVDPF